jgi:hypothetical protein
MRDHQVKMVRHKRPCQQPGVFPDFQAMERPGHAGRMSVFPEDLRPLVRGEGHQISLPRYRNAPATQGAMAGSAFSVEIRSHKQSMESPAIRFYRKYPRRPVGIA